MVGKIFWALTHLAADSTPDAPVRRQSPPWPADARRRSLKDAAGVRDGRGVVGAVSDERDSREPRQPGEHALLIRALEVADPSHGAIIFTYRDEELLVRA